MNFEIIKVNSKTNTREVVATAATKERADALAVRFTLCEGLREVKYESEPKR